MHLLHLLCLNIHTHLSLIIPMFTLTRLSPYPLFHFKFILAHPFIIPHLFIYLINPHPLRNLHLLLGFLLGTILICQKPMFWLLGESFGYQSVSFSSFGVEHNFWLQTCSSLGGFIFIFSSSEADDYS
jgi:hypothetical protein